MTYSFTPTEDLTADLTKIYTDASGSAKPMSEAEIATAEAAAILAATEAGNPPLENVATNIKMNGVQAAGSLATVARGDHVHPSDTSRVPTSRTVNSKALSANITLSTADISDSTDRRYMTDTQETKLDSVELNADVTDAVNIAASINSAGTITLADADEVPVLDASGSYSLLKTTWTSIKAFLKSYFDTLYKATFTENTAFNKSFETSTSNIKMDGTVSVGALSTIARADHIHPSDTSKVGTTGNQSIDGMLTLTDRINLPNYNYVNYVFAMIENASPQYILLCENSANNDVNGSIRMDRTSGNYQASHLDIVVSSSSSAMVGGYLSSAQVLQSSEKYKLVTITYNSISYVAIKYTGNSYPMTTGAYFTGRLRSSGLMLTAIDSSGVSNEADFGGSSKINFDTDIVTVNENTVWHAGNDGSGSGMDSDKVDNCDVEDTLTGSTSKIPRSDAVKAVTDLKLNSSSYTASDVLTKLLTVDGSGSNLDADLFEGQHGSYYQNAGNLNEGYLSKARLSTDGSILYEMNPIIPASGKARQNLGYPTLAEMALISEEMNNKLQFHPIAKITAEYTTDDITWLTWSLTDAQKQNLVLGRNAGQINITNGWLKSRIIFEANSYVYLNNLYIYMSTQGHQCSFLIEKSYDGSSWINVVSNSGDIKCWPGHVFLPHSNIPFNPTPTYGTHYKYIRVTFVPTWSSSYPSNAIALYNLNWYGGYPSSLKELYIWDYNKNITFPANIYASNIVVLTGNQTIGGVKTFSSFPVTPSSSPTSAYEVANKQYVDAKAVGGSVPTVAPASPVDGNVWIAP